MNILIFTQKVDLNDTVLSFFHRWIIEIAKHFDQVTVICLYLGSHDLPQNVRVLSLGKERGESKIGYLKNFYSYIFKCRKDYDAVLSHMNQEYILLGGLFWRIMGKRVYMWRNHYAGSILTDMAAFFCNKVFCTSKYSWTARYKKTVFMPVGVDMEIFSKDESVIRVPRSILSLGRISPSKKIENLIAAFDILKKQNMNFTATICGDALPKDEGYLNELKLNIDKSGLQSNIKFIKGVPNTSTPKIYSANEVFVNLSPSGMLDKTIFEAMGCETVALSCSKDLALKISPEYIFEEGNAEDLAAKITSLFSLKESVLREKAKNLRSFAEMNHSLRMLGSRLKEEIS